MNCSLGLLNTGIERFLCSLTSKLTHKVSGSFPLSTRSKLIDIHDMYACVLSKSKNNMSYSYFLKKNNNNTQVERKNVLLRIWGVGKYQSKKSDSFLKHIFLLSIMKVFLLLSLCFPSPSACIPCISLAVDSPFQ